MNSIEVNFETYFAVLQCDKGLSINHYKLREKVQFFFF